MYGHEENQGKEFTSRFLFCGILLYIKTKKNIAANICKYSVTYLSSAPVMKFVSLMRAIQSTEHLNGTERNKDVILRYRKK